MRDLEIPVYLYVLQNALRNMLKSVFSFSANICYIRSIRVPVLLVGKLNNDNRVYVWDRRSLFICTSACPSEHAEECSMQRRYIHLFNAVQMQLDVAVFGLGLKFTNDLQYIVVDEIAFASVDGEHGIRWNFIQGFFKFHFV